MTAKQQTALDYFDRISRCKGNDETTFRAISILLKSARSFGAWKDADTLTGAGFSVIRWFHFWHSTGCEGGISRFERGLRNALKATMFTPKKGSGIIKRVKGVSDDKPVLEGEGTAMIFDKARATYLVKVWNLEEKEKRSEVRYRVSMSRFQKGTDKRLIIKYEIDLEPQKALSLDHQWHEDDTRGQYGDRLLHHHGSDYDSDGDDFGDFDPFRDDAF